MPWTWWTLRTSAWSPAACSSSSPTAVFVKLERRFGFFDEAGWRSVPAWLPEPLEAPARRQAPELVELERT